MFRFMLTIGRIAAIPIRIHWSWMAALLIVVGILSQLYAGIAPGAGAWVMAASAGLLLCVSVILHELGHALAARRYRFTVRSITLFAVGGVAEIDAENTTPIQELVVAIAGPVVSLLLALVTGLIWWYSPWVPLSLLALHLTLTNGLMAVFNLLPGFPMDGGRVLHAAIWFLTDEELPAARVASWVGRVCGWGLIAIAVVYVVSVGDPLGAAWMGVIGYFLIRSASAGYRHLVLQRTLHGIAVADLMQRAYRAVAPELPLDQFVGRYVLGQVDQGFPVLYQPEQDEPQLLLGMMTLRDLRRFTFNEWSLTRVGEAMTPAHRIRTLAPEMGAREAFRTLLESGEEQLPVIEGGALMGILRRRDLVRYIQMRLKQPLAHRR
ncbi:MAG TPA: site-2 protease family protein [Roseiflexaceae bacterium]|nr:site-2 protease family protein [Roseiflexaceae bacterium]